jgi:serine O-acetyltransferase
VGPDQTGRPQALIGSLLRKHPSPHRHRRIDLPESDSTMDTGHSTPDRQAHAAPVSATVPDWSREAKPFWAWMPSRSLLASLRAYERHAARRTPWHALLRKWAVLRHRFWSVVTGADIPLGCRIAGGLLLPHPNGVVVHSDVVIGPNCLLFQQVTLGAGPTGVPKLGGHVDVGAGAKVLGRVHVGDHALIGANAVVMRDVPSGATAVGVPAVVKGGGDDGR